ncbi:hypothetical protein [Methylomonas sp. AM2-LC]|uniref:hypothetical protein n=1 Tax=Methylomonas sp. AM2-LC TaxID=3153301 RepID=UPI003264EB70
MNKQVFLMMLALMGCTNQAPVWKDHILSEQDALYRLNLCKEKKYPQIEDNYSSPYTIALALSIQCRAARNDLIAAIASQSPDPDTAYMNMMLESQDPAKSTDGFLSYVLGARSADPQVNP